VTDLAGNASFSDFVTYVIEAAAPPAQTNELKIILNGKQLTFDVPPESRNGRTLVPVRALFEALGATVGWNAETQTATATRGSTVVELQINNSVAKRNGEVVTLDQPPVLVGGRTLMPLRFVSESLGAQVGWDEATRTITITTPQ